MKEDIWQKKLNIDAETLLTQWEQAESLAAVAEAQEKNPQLIVAAILKEEKKGIEASVQRGENKKEEAELVYKRVEDDLKNFVFFTRTPSDLIWTAESISWLLNSLLYSNKKLLIIDTSGKVIYDSENIIQGKTLSTAMQEQARGYGMKKRINILDL